MVKQASLPKHGRDMYNQSGPLCVYTLTKHLFSGRGGSIHALRVFPDQATRLFELSPTPRTCFAMDEASDDLPCARHIRRFDQRQSRTAGGKRVVTTPTDHLASTGQTTRLPENRPAAFGAAGQDGPNLETSALPCPARDAAAASTVSSSSCSGSTNQRRVRESRSSHLRLPV